jgi:hypothetical protein
MNLMDKNNILKMIIKKEIKKEITFFNFEEINTNTIDS